MNSKSRHEVAIIGGGPAGSIAGIYLTRFGIDTCIIEKKIFPRDVVCGEFLSSEIEKSLRELDLYQNFLALNPNQISKFRTVNEQQTEISAELDFPAFSMKRSIFDTFLLNSAKKSGVEIYQPAEVKLIRNAGNNFKLHLKITDNNEEKIIESNNVIAAYGKQNRLDKILGRKFTYYNSCFNGIKFHVPNQYIEDFSGDEIRIYTGKNIYCGINKLSDNETTVCFLEKRMDINSSSRKSVINLIGTNEKFGELFKNDFEEILNDLPIYGTGNIYFGKKNLVENGIFMTGDAARMIAPFTGDGIGMAFQSARLISTLLNEQKIKKYGQNVLEKNYKSEWNRLFIQRIRKALLIQKYLMNNKTNEISFKFLKTFPYILQNFIKSTRSIQK